MSHSLFAASDFRVSAPFVARRSSCVAALLALGGALWSADGYRFAIGETRQYLSETKQQVSWQSADDTLIYISTIATNQAWTCTAIDGNRATLRVAILRVLAQHQGPGSDYRFDSAARRDPDSTADRLLGHLAALEGTVLTVQIDQDSGVSTVTGGARIAEAMATRAPNLMDPTGPSPLAAQTDTAWSDATLSRVFSQTLALPSPVTATLTLGQPLSGTLPRTWKELAYQFAGEPTGTITLTKEPSLITATVRNVTGNGTADIAPDGWPGTPKGTLTFSLAIDAMTQPVQQQHTVTWQLLRM